MGTITLNLGISLGNPPTPIVNWTTAAGTDAIGLFSVTLDELNEEGDVVIVEYDDSSSFVDAVVYTFPALTSQDIMNGSVSGSTATRSDGTWYIRAQSVRNSSYSSGWQDPPDSEVIASTPVETTEIITYNGFTFNFDGPVEYGQFLLGDPYFLADAGVQLLSVTPAWTGTQNGAMINPSATNIQGYDNQVSGQRDPFSAGARQTFPVTMTAGQSLVCIRSKVPPQSGGAEQYVSDSVVLTCLAAHPASPSTTFRPAYAGAVKTQYTTADIVGTLPNLTSPAGKTIPSINSAAATMDATQQTAYVFTYYDYVLGKYGAKSPLAYPIVNHGIRTATQAMHADNDIDPYRRQLTISRMAALLLIDHPARETIRNRMLQHAIDLKPIADFNLDSWSANAGFGLGVKFPLVFAAVMFNDASFNVTQTTTSRLQPWVTVRKFAEDGYTFLGATTVEYPGGIPLIGADQATGEATESITGVTLSNPIVITCPGHGVDAGVSTSVRISGTGVTEIDDRDFLGTRVSATQFSLNGENGAGYTTYVSGGTALFTSAPSKSTNRDPDGLLNSFGYLRSDGTTVVGSIVVPAELDLINRGQYTGTAAQGMCGQALAAHHITGMRAAWNHEPFFLFAKRFVEGECDYMYLSTYNDYNRDIWGFGGTGNAWMKTMWQDHGY